jgi:hypothetical protein
MESQTRTKWWAQLGDWFDERFDVRVPLQAFLKKPVPKHAIRWYFCLGGITFTLFMIQGITGILLSLYYKPTTADAYESILFIMNNVRFGWLVRSIHSWAATLMIAACVAQEPPRVELGSRCRSVAVDPGLWFYGLPVALGPEGVVGFDGGQRDPGRSPLDWGLAAGSFARWR